MSYADDIRTAAGTVLRAARERAGLTQEELAQEAGLDRSYISQLENGRKGPTLFVWMLLCDALGTSPSRLIQKLERLI